MANFSLIVQKKYNELDATQKKIFVDEFKRRKKSVGIAYLLWFFLGWHYAYVNKWALLLLYIITLGGFFIWALIDLFRIPGIINEYNNSLALSILRDITLMFGGKKEENTSSENNLKTIVNDPYLIYRRKSNKNYSWIIFLVLFVGFVVVTANMKPDRLKMENKIVDKIMENNPELVIVFKNLFFGKEMKEEYVKNFISFTLKNNGYEDVIIYDYNFGILRKVEIRDTNTGEILVKAYGAYGKTFVKLNYKDEIGELSNNEKDYAGEKINENEKVEIKKNITWLYGKNKFLNNEESKRYRIIEMQKGDLVNVIEYGNKEEMIKVRLYKNGKIYEGYIVPSAINF